MNKTTFAIVIAAGLGVTALAVTASAHGPGWGKGQTYGAGYSQENCPNKQAMQQGQMKHRGFSRHMMGWFGGDLDLNVEKVRDMIESKIARHGQDRLKPGKIEIKDDKTIVAEIVTVDDSLVMKFEIDRKTGAHRPVK